MCGMSTREIRVIKSFATIDFEALSHIVIIIVLLIASVIYGTYFMPERAVLVERKGTVQKANSIVLHSNNELLASVDFTLEPIERELKPEAMKTSAEAAKTEMILKPAEISRPETTPETAPVLPEVIVPVMSYNGSLRGDYCVGSSVDLNELELLLDENPISLEACIVEGLDTSIAGEYIANIIYGEYFLEIPYSVLDYKAVLHGAGEEVCVSLVDYELDENVIGIPVRLGKEFSGWYRDKECTIPFVSALPGETIVDLYAGWKDFDKFVCDDAGYITGYTGAYGSIIDGLLNLTAHPSCVGVRADAFINLDEFVTDIYIPANITHIESGAFDCLPYVFYIYAHPDNPVYASDNGILYTKDMSTVVAYPSCR